jgi:hypothetical protein
MIAVIGSGPSAFAVSTLLDELGIEFEILDVGDLPKKTTSGLIEVWRKSNVDKYEAMVKSLPDIAAVTNSNVGRKTFFGDSFSYQTNSSDWKNSSGTQATSSSGVGGFSHVWGATLLPFSKSDKQYWPSKIQDLEQEIDEIYSLIPTASNFRISSINYGLPPTGANSFAQDLRISRLMNRSSFQSIFDGNDSELLSSRLALDTGTCTPCSSCISGCPQSSIWSSQKYFLEKKGDLIKFVEVSRIIEKPNSVSIQGNSQGKTWIKDYSRVILSAGPIGSAGILTRSGISKNINVKDSQTVFLTGVWLSKVNTSNKKMVTLSQAFARLEPTFATKAIHIQIYGWNPTLPYRIRKEVPISRFIPFRVVSMLSKLLVNFIVYFDADDSDFLTVNGHDSGAKIYSKVSAELPNSAVEERQRKEIKALTQKLRRSGILTSMFFARWAGIGEGYHSGSSFPYLVETDQYARPTGTNGRIHLLDSSILPSIPSGPLTLSVMAVVRKVAKQIVADLDDEKSQLRR